MGKKIIRGILIILAVVLVAAGGYVAYMQFSYYRIDDFTMLDTESNQDDAVRTGETYRITTYNMGFGAYSDDYTFFMDTGEMKDGTATTGKYARGMSEAEVKKNIQGSISLVRETDSDFLFLQEVDTDATRSYHIDQVDMVRQSMDDYGLIFASNFHSAYLLYPFTQPHGAVQAGLVTLSRYHVEENTRRQFPVDNSFFIKFTDLDRCFVITRCPVEDGRELVLIHLHLSAYDKGGTIRARQLELLNQVLEEEYTKGNYVIAGGDFNHDIAGSIDSFPSEQNIPSWVFQLSDEDLADGLHFVRAENADQVPTCRGADIPYEKGVTYTTIVDGFIVSDNIQAKAVNLDNEFLYSDHNPVTMEFTLLP